VRISPSTPLVGATTGDGTEYTVSAAAGVFTEAKSSGANDVAAITTAYKFKVIDTMAPAIVLSQSTYTLDRQNGTISIFYSEPIAVGATANAKLTLTPTGSLVGTNAASKDVAITTAMISNNRNLHNNATGVYGVLVVPVPSLVLNVTTTFHVSSPAGHVTDLSTNLAPEILAGALSLQVPLAPTPAPTAAPTSAPTNATAAPTAAPGTYTTSQTITQSVTIAIARRVAQYTGNVKDATEVAYGLVLSIYNAVSNAYETGCSISSSATGTAAAAKVTLVATVSAAKAAAAVTASKALTTAQFTAQLTRAVALKGYTDVTVTVQSVSTPTVAAASTTASGSGLSCSMNAVALLMAASALLLKM